MLCEDSSVLSATAAEKTLAAFWSELEAVLSRSRIRVKLWGRRAPAERMEHKFYSVAESRAVRLITVDWLLVTIHK